MVTALAAALRPEEMGYLLLLAPHVRGGVYGVATVRRVEEVPHMPSSSDLRRKLQEAQRKVQREVDRVNQVNKQKVDAYNRSAAAHNKKVIDDHNRKVDQHNRKAEQHNKEVVAEINRRLNAPVRTKIVYAPAERALVDRVHDAIAFDDGREYDVSISYARIDGEATAQGLMQALQSRGVKVWFDAVAIQPGKSQSLQMDAGLRKARAGIAVLTPAYLTGRFWTERELGALLHKPTLIPVLHGVTFDDVKEYSGILPDLAGFTTANDHIDEIAEKIAPAVLANAA